LEVHLTPDQEAFIRLGVETGRFHGPEEAVAEALSLWEARERMRVEILDAVCAAEASLARGDGRPITAQSMQEVAREVSRRGRARLETEKSNPR
jgi:Arc/MetJ-type ribon-helix-helix transcriptional regulator